MSLSLDQILHVARLARIEIGESETQVIMARLNRMLGLIDQLRAVDTTGIKPMSHAQDVVQRLRPDEVTETDQHQAYQAVAPTVERGLYLVPKVIE